MRLEDNKVVSEYTQESQSINDQFEPLGMTWYADEETLFAFMKGLGQAYKPFTVKVKAQPHYHPREFGQQSPKEW
jgi:hypothetical protein